MTEIVSFILNGEKHSVFATDVSGWEMNYRDTGIVLTLHGYTLVSEMCSISGVHIKGKPFESVPAVIVPVDDNTKIIILRSQFKL